MPPTRIDSGPSSGVSGVDAWRTLEALSLYRAAVCIALLALMSSQYRPSIFGTLRPLWMDATLYLYLFVAALLLIMVRGQRPILPWQAAIQIALDMMAIGILVYASAGVSSGLGILLITPIAAGSLLLDRRLGILPPAIATLMLLAIELYLNLDIADHAENFTQTGMLGAALFIIATAGGTLAKRTRESEARASRAEGNIVKLSQLGETIIQKLQAGVLVVDGPGRIELLNHAARELLGENARFGATLADCSEPLWRRLQTWRFDPTSLSSSAVKLPGEHKAWAQFTRLGRGGDAATLVVLDDASRVGEQAQAMKLASLGRLTASIAHELRNPLAAIRHATELLEESPDVGGHDRPLLAIIERQSNRLNTIITSILGLSGKPRAVNDSIDLRAFLNSFVKEFLSSQDEARPRIRLDVHPPQIAIRVDSIQLGQVMHNLLENASKHGRTPERELEIHIDAHLALEGNKVLIDIRDNGPGISPSAAAHIFEPFFSTRHGGTGLGLFITRELCQAADGELQLIPQANQAGAFFRVSFPAEPVTRAA